jgi:hypothetical protein
LLASTAQDAKLINAEGSTALCILCALQDVLDAGRYCAIIRHILSGEEDAEGCSFMRLQGLLLPTAAA